MIQDSGALTIEAPPRLPLSRPEIGDPETIASDVLRILESGIITNGSYVRELERRASEYLGVRNCIAVSSCTSGLMLVLRAADLSGDVVVPSFTFFATAHAVRWNGLRPVFADIDARRLTLSHESAQKAAGVRTSAILATHTYGAPCDIEALAAVAARNGIRLFFDAAHAFGSMHGGRKVGGFGDAEVFSLSPTKLLVAGEGGIIATDNDDLAERCRIGRNYGDPGDYDCRFVGLNARMSEFHAAVALASFDGIEERIERRNRLVECYASLLEDVPGLSLQQVPVEDRSTYKDFTVLVDPNEAGVSADEIAGGLALAGIDSRRYFSPAVHSTRAYRALSEVNGNLSVTHIAAERVLTLPLWSGMTEDQVMWVAETVRSLIPGRPHLSANGRTGDLKTGQKGA